MNLRRLVGLATLSCALLLAGCGGPRIVPVKGTITRKGKPVPYLFINFMPEGGRPSWGVTDEAGRFTLAYDDKQNGALVGTHTVWVQWRPRSPQEEFDPGHAAKPQDLDAILARYGKQETTPLRIEVSASKPEVEIKVDD
jgi:hypothetical protein